MAGSMKKLHKGIKKHLKEDISMYKKEAKEDRGLLKKLKGSKCPTCKRMMKKPMLEVEIEIEKPKRKRNARKKK